MRIKQVRIENFRVFSDVTVSFDKYSCLIGANGAGKSNVLCALNLFFRQATNVPTDVIHPQIEDFHHKNVSSPIRITVTFTDLNAEATEDFRDYVRQEELIITAEAIFDSLQGTASVKQYGQRKIMKAFAKYFEADKAGSSADDLKKIYESLKTDFSDLPVVRTKQAMRQALQQFENEHPDLCEEHRSGDEFYGFSKGANRLAQYVQWVFVPAVKDAVSEQSAGRNTALSQILDRAVKARTRLTEDLSILKNELQNKYLEILSQNQNALTELSNELASKIREWAHPGASLKLEWQQPGSPVSVSDPLATIMAKEGTFEGQLARFGHGLQRSYIFALLHVLSKVDDSSSPTLILGCEEPELYQHPPQLRYLASVFKQLAVRNSQIVVCTHSPHFVTGSDFEDVRLIQKSDSNGCGRVSQVKSIDLASEMSRAYAGNRPPEQPPSSILKLNQILRPEINEMFFAPVVILVEGHEDLAFLSAYMQLMGHYETFRQLGCHIVPCGKKSLMDRPLAVTNLMRLKRFVMFDADGDQSGERRISHENWNRALFRLANHDRQDVFPNDAIFEADLIVWPHSLDKAVWGELDESQLRRIKEEVRSEFGFPPDADKATLFITSVLSRAWESNNRSESLMRTCDSIINFASS